MIEDNSANRNAALDTLLGFANKVDAVVEAGVEIDAQKISPLAGAALTLVADLLGNVARIADASERIAAALEVANVTSKPVEEVKAAGRSFIGKIEG